MATKDLVLSCQSKSKILKWHVKQGETVKKGQILATYIFTEKVDPEKLMAQCKLKAKLNGKVVELSVKPNDEILKGYEKLDKYYEMHILQPSWIDRVSHTIKNAQFS